MNLSETMTFQVTTADDFGDDVLSTEYETAVAVEPASAFSYGINGELQAGELLAWIAPDSEVWKARRLQMSGMVAQYEGQSYRVIGVRPGASLLTGEEDLIELTLAKSETSDER